MSPELAGILRNWRAEPEARLTRRARSCRKTAAIKIDVHIAPLVGNDDGPVLIFLEDASLMAEKVQQTKLAALGRLSASIAHEIRNPVGAMSHAGQLLNESEQVGADRAAPARHHQR